MDHLISSRKIRAEANLGGKLQLQNSVGHQTKLTNYLQDEPSGWVVVMH